MESLNYFQYGPLTPVLAFVMACVGLGLGLRCLVRATDLTGLVKRNWLIVAAVAVSSGVWTMYLIAMLGFAVEGSPIRFDVPLTLVSLLLTLSVGGAGIAAASYTPSQPLRLILGGVGLGGSIVVTHYTGMAAMRLHGTMSYDVTVVALSVLIAVGAASAALALALYARSARGTLVAALVIGAGAAGAQYTGLAALRLEVHLGTDVLPGASAVEFIFPLTVIFGSFLFLSSAFVALSPLKQGREATLTDEAEMEPDSEFAS
jgi:NO-binding membrane sensor protein with MHYT domain